MDSYFELKALPDPEIIQSAVIAELMNVLHPLLTTFNGRIGLDFPAYGQQRTLGGIIRLLGKKNDIEQLYRLLEADLAVQDYAMQTTVAGIPDNVQTYASLQRRQARGSNSRFRRLKERHQKRGSWTEELELAVLTKYTEPLHLPHVKMKSASTSQSFLLFIERKISKQSVSGTFNSYGLTSQETGNTVPSF